MLCTRCHQRETLITPEKRAEIEAKLGVAWPFGDLCKQCLEDLLKEDDPEVRARIKTFMKAAGTKVKGEIEKDLRSAAGKVLDFADRLLGKQR
ncbi:MAG TPA: hypothetical protein VG454_15640 [Gemmatimonadales bacterium]|nr:hypothetical protein [Gemmatimonadales bacterium]